MNAKLLEAFAKLPTAAIGSSRGADANCVAVNEAGDIVVLCDDGRLQYSSLRGISTSNATEATVFKSLPVNNSTPEDFQQYTNIDFDAGGSLLLLWSSAKVGMIEIPLESIANGTMDFSGLRSNTCSYTELTDELWRSAGTIDYSSTKVIVKVSFHSLCPHSIVVLFDRDCLLLMDLRSLHVQVHSVVLPNPSDAMSDKFVSFCFGPCLDWLSFSIVLLTSLGQVYLLCPVIPPGTEVALSTVNDLWSWLDQLALLRENDVDYYDEDTTGLPHHLYISLVQAFLCKTFGPRPVATDGAAEQASRERFLRAGETEEIFETNVVLNSVGTLTEDAELLSGYVVKLLGPLQLQSAVQLFNNSAQEGMSEEEKGCGESSLRNSVLNKKVSKTNTPNEALDICVPGSSNRISAAAADQLNGVPVLLVSTSTGDVEILLFDADAASAVAELSFAGPSWRPIDFNAIQLVYPQPLCLLPVETVALCDEDSSPSSQCWFLSPDPVLPHAVHAYNSNGNSYLINIQWLNTVMHGLGDGGDISAPMMSSSVLPILDPAQFTCRGDTEQKKDSLNDSSPLRLTGMRVICDAVAGHIAIFKGSQNGVAYSINLNTCMKLLDLQEDIDSSMHFDFNEDVQDVKRKLAESLSDERLRWKNAQMLIQKVADGLKDMPVVTTTAGSDSVEQTNAQNKKLLLETAAKLESQVLIPMNELAHSNMFNLQLLKEELAAQTLIVEGKNLSVQRHDASASELPTGVPLLHLGLKQLGERLSDQRDELSARLRRIQNRFEQQKNAVEKIITFAINTRTKMSKAEHLYKHQLQEWSHVVSKMNQQITLLMQIARATTTQPYGSPGQYSQTTTSVASAGTTGTVLSSGDQKSTKPVLAWRPAGGMINQHQFGYSSIRGSSAGAGIGFTPKDHSSVAASFSSPHFKANNSINSTPFASPGVIKQQQYTPSPSFNLRPPLTMASEFQSTGSWRSPMSSAHTMTPQRNQPMSVPREAVDVDRSDVSSILLSPEDQKACTTLLDSQTQLLEKAETEVKELEQRLQKLQRLQSPKN